MGVINDPSGRPRIELSGGAADRLADFTPDGYSSYIHLSLTDDHPYAMAYVVIELRGVKWRNIQKN